MPGKLYLIPSTLGSENTEKVLPPFIREVINEIDYYIAENERTVRRFLIKAGLKTPVDTITFYILNKHTKPEEISTFLKPALDGKSMAVVSEAGCPGVADPGAEIVKRAHLQNIKVIPLTGPSSIILALMASGLNGQNFAFNGYLPVKTGERQKKIRFYERRSIDEQQAQVFIEAPYRNMQLLGDIISVCNKNTRLCIAVDITLDTEKITTKTITQWAKQRPDLHKRPAIFIIQG